MGGNKPLDKMTKKERKEFFKKQRVSVGFNTGNRTHKTEKHPSRSRQKQIDRRERQDD